MYIKELEINNFKSFAHEVKIPFLEGFTTISGPNGSGKSNIIDSILFALGFATTKKLRAEKSDDYICTKSNKKEAYVRVTFGFSGKPDEQLTVARKFAKGTQGYGSTYYLDDKISTLGDIHAKLEKYNITPNSYNVVMQREVLNIMSYSDNERRKIIEEIAGTAEFDRQTDKARDELAVVKQRVEQTEIIVEELSKTLERLESERETALKYEELRKQKSELESKVSLVRFFDIKKALEIAHESILEASKKKKSKEVELKQLSEKIAEITKRFDEIEAKVKQNGADEQLNLSKKLGELKGLISSKEESIDRADKNIHLTKRQIENQKNGIANANKKIDGANAAIKEIEAKIEAVNEAIRAKNEELNKTLSEVTGLSKTAEAYVTRRAELGKNYEKFKFDEIELQKEALPLENKLEQNKKNLKAANEALAASKTFKEEFANNKDKLELEIEELEKEQNDCKLAQQNLFEEADKIRNELNDKSHEIQMMYRRISMLEGQRTASEGAAGRAVETVLNSGLKGIRSTLANLGKVATKYATALEVAMGGRMRNIVVDNTAAAKAAIDILQTAKAGRATFLPLDRIAKAPSSLRLPKEKGVIDFAVNLIDFDDEYIDAFYLALGETLIVEEFEDAKALQAKLPGKYRTVTLQGALFERSGAITGGEKINNPGLKFAQDDDELEKYKAKLKQTEREYSDLERRNREIDERQQKIRQSYSSALDTLGKAKNDLRNLIANNKSSEDKILEFEKSKKALEPEIKVLEAKLDEIELKRVELNEKMLTAKEEIDEIDKKMNEGELKKLKDLTSAIENEIKKRQNEISGLNSEKTAQNDIIGFNKIVADTNKRTVEEYEKSIVVLEEDKVRFAKDIETARAHMVELEGKNEELTKKLEEFRKESDAVKAELMDAEKKKTIAESEIEKITEQSESYRARRRELEPQLDEVKTELNEAGINVNTVAMPEMTTDAINAQIKKLQSKMSEMEPVNMTAIKTYEVQSERKKELDEKIATLMNERVCIEERMNGYEKDKKESFNKTFNAINDNFGEIFNTLADGTGSLVLENPENPFEGGMSIIAQPGGKDTKRLSLMSGGEQSITVLALVFAIQRYSPAPFYALDEVDGSLDGINVEKVADVISKQAKNTQFIVVSHRKTMIESGDRTIGVTHKNGVTKVTGIKLRDE